MTSLPPQPIEPQTPQNLDHLQQKPQPQSDRKPSRQLINFNSDQRLTINSLTPLQQGEIGDDEGFYGCGGILVLGD
jgi:hypothetical protein